MTAASAAVGLLLDEMFSPMIALALRRRGHDVVAVAADPHLRAMTDGELCEWAAAQSRRIVTENVKDFRRLRGRGAGANSPALLYTSSRTFPRSRRATGLLLAALEHWLTQPDVSDRPPEDWLVRAPSG